MSCCSTAGFGVKPWPVNLQIVQLAYLGGMTNSNLLKKLNAQTIDRSEYRIVSVIAKAAISTGLVLMVKTETKNGRKVTEGLLVVSYAKFGLGAGQFYNRCCYLNAYDSDKQRAAANQDFVYRCH